VNALSDLETFLRTRLTEPLPGAQAQWRFAPKPARKGWDPGQTPESARHAAALILIYPGAEGPSIPLTLRHSTLPHHPGQISLPGGRLDAGERPEDAALREAHEEIGVDPASVRIVGPLSTLWVVVSNHLLHPFIGITDTPPEFKLAEREVEALIEAPVEHIRDSERLRQYRLARDGIIVDYQSIELGGHPVWGATAMVLGEFRELFG